jgi:fucose 4-O-acetylase-like acetyltransferase
MLTSENTSRMYWLDNLRTCLVFLVVLIHAAVVYEKTGMGTLWWIVSDPSTSDVPGMLFLILNIFVIATLFFISGYLAPLSLAHKTRWAFCMSKVKRLIVPWAIAVLTLIPLYKIIFLSSRGLPQEDWTTYLYWNTLWSQNWLWFLPVLFLFNVLYVGLASLRISMSHISVKCAVVAVFILSFLYSFCMDVLNLHGWTKTLLLDFQNERLLIYFMMFLLGSLCGKREVFVSAWHHKNLDVICHSTGWIPLNLYVFLLIYSLLNPGATLVSDLVDTLFLRLNFTLSLAYLVYTMTTTFRKHLNRQSKISSTLSTNSYGVYIIHVVVMGALALPMLNTAMPSLSKLLLLTLSTFGVSHVIMCSFRRCVKQLCWGRHNLNKQYDTLQNNTETLCLRH